MPRLSWFVAAALSVAACGGKTEDAATVAPASSSPSSDPSKPTGSSAPSDIGASCDPLATKRSPAKPLGTAYEVVRSSDGVLYVVEGSPYDPMSMRVFIEEDGVLVARYSVGAGGAENAWQVFLDDGTTLSYSKELKPLSVTRNGKTRELSLAARSAISGLPLVDAASKQITNVETLPDGRRFMMIVESNGNAPTYHVFSGVPPLLEERAVSGVTEIESGRQPDFLVSGRLESIFFSNANTVETTSKPTSELLAGLVFTCL